ncbi:MAG: hypothetical protein U9R47_07515 [Actinomycetota bacterium]|nr:hypothetical protein [Actinomycetota bacterium]
MIETSIEKEAPGRIDGRATSGQSEARRSRSTSSSAFKCQTVPSSQTPSVEGTRTVLAVEEDAFARVLPGAAHVSVVRTNRGSGLIVHESVDPGEVVLSRTTSGFGVIIEAQGRDDAVVLAGAIEAQSGGRWDGAPTEQGLFTAYGASGHHIASIPEGFVGGQIVVDRGAVEDAIGVL